MTETLGVYQKLECCGDSLALGDIVVAIAGRDALGVVIEDHGFLSLGAWPRALPGPGLGIEAEGSYTVMRLIPHGCEALELLELLEGYVAGRAERHGVPCSVEAAPAVGPVSR